MPRGIHHQWWSLVFYRRRFPYISDWCPKVPINFEGKFYKTDLVEDIHTFPTPYCKLNLKHPVRSSDWLLSYIISSTVCGQSSCLSSSLITLHEQWSFKRRCQYFCQKYAILTMLLILLRLTVRTKSSVCAHTYRNLYFMNELALATVMA